MPGRVIPHADSINAGYYLGTPEPIRNAFGTDFVEDIGSYLRPYSSSVQADVDLWLNKKWINYQMLEGKK
ncbi:MAG: hypothetical protein Q4P66_04850 [Actinomycetaceae bacterium]|nr:hypothetical protein [Actinomycetaceae bacterium]MDO5746972.1 hypothetical protein [Actinomycetaceae bacterium]